MSRYDDGIPERTPGEPDAEERKRLAWMAWEADPQREADWRLADRQDRAANCRGAGQRFTRMEPQWKTKSGKAPEPIIRSDGAVFQSVADAARASGLSGHSAIITAMKLGRMMMGGYRFYYLNSILAEGRRLTEADRERKQTPAKIAKQRKAA